MNCDKLEQYMEVQSERRKTSGPIYKVPKRTVNFKINSMIYMAKTIWL